MGNAGQGPAVTPFRNAEAPASYQCVEGFGHCVASALPVAEKWVGMVGVPELERH